MIALTGPADLRDQRWLDERVAAIEDGVESVIDIARNWTDGRNLARLHPKVSAAEYVTSHVGALGKSVVPVLLAESNWSNRQIAAVAGVSDMTVGRVAKSTASDVAVERPAKTLGADGKLRRATVVRTVQAEVIEPTPDLRVVEPQKEAPIERPDTRLWDALVGVMDAIEALSESDAPSVAATVPDRRRAASAKRLRKLGTFLGRIAWSLESEGEPE